MKNTFKTIFAIAAGVFAASCTKENASPLENSAYPLVEFTAVSNDTKTVIEEGHTLWSANDQIKVYFGTESATAKLKTGEGTASATYEVRVPETASAYYAVYPASAESALVEEDSLSIVIPASQSGVFGAGHIAVAKAVDKTFDFVNINSFLKIQLGSPKYTKITVESVGGQALAGTQAFKFTGTDIVAGDVTNPVSTVEIASTEPFAAGDLYISVLPGINHEKGLLVKYYRGEEVQGTYFLEKAVVTEASKILSFGQFEPSSDYFVTPVGTGTKSGTSWDNAMDPAALVKLITYSDPSTLETKLNAINGTTINFSVGTFDLGDLVTIGFARNDVELNFVGGYALEGSSDTETVISGSDSHRLLVIEDGVKASFENISFSHSFSSTSGEPAVILKAGSDISLKNCKITDNVNMKTDGSKYNTCGGFSVEAGVTFKAENCEFARNKASWGASIIVRGDASFKNCEFHHNNGVNGPGNSLYLDAADAALTVDNCQFHDNTCSDTHGGAFGATGGVSTFTGCNFENNVQTNKNGAAIRTWNSAKAVLNNCTVKGNHANYGGALYLENTSEIDIIGGTYEANYAKGGGLVNAASTSIVDISGNAVIKGNYATNGHGGALLIDGGKLICRNVTFSGNINKTASGGIFGAAIGTTGGCLADIQDCTFSENHSDSFGGSALNLQGGATLILKNSLFEGNYNECKGISATNNNGNYGGGALRINCTGGATVEDCIFRNNSIELATSYNHAYGGAVYVNTGAADKPHTFNRCFFDSNYATRGGALCAWATNAKVYMNDCAFTGNWISYRYGTTIHVEKATEFCMNNCSIADNTYTTGGNGAWQSCWLNLAEISGGLCISNSSFIGSPRVGNEASINSGVNSAIVRFDTLGSDNNYFVNDIIVTEAAVGDNKTLANYNKSITMAYLRRSDNSANGAGGSTTAVESPVSNGFFNSTDCFGGLQWMSGSTYAANYWKWSGSLAGGNNLTLCPAATAVEHIGKIAGFKTWLESIEALDKDQLGNSRGSGDWWPGAYQPAAQ